MEFMCCGCLVHIGKEAVHVCSFRLTRATVDCDCLSSDYFQLIPIHRLNVVNIHFLFLVE